MVTASPLQSHDEPRRPIRGRHYLGGFEYARSPKNRNFSQPNTRIYTRVQGTAQSPSSAQNNLRRNLAAEAPDAPIYLSVVQSPLPIQQPRPIRPMHSEPAVHEVVARWTRVADDSDLWISTHRSQPSLRRSSTTVTRSSYGSRISTENATTYERPGLPGPPNMKL
ncbi:hypothetical protein EJ04DRAFT_527713 [Polyplosphaeria fusca]|uniref:Uncharacterized protein n=1 Tax=Polyplosphaeria fusca TaxID=682080 RepID=A0A9P4UY05_9PLEO|nr:hypothetical protein EJ04DRAFT_527713 [Polyplosphaeria fusca]